MITDYALSASHAYRSIWDTLGVQLTMRLRPRSSPRAFKVRRLTPAFMEDLTGYKGRALSILKKAGANVGDVLEVRTNWGTVAGTLVPRYATGDGDHVVLKLDSGYNVGLEVSKLKGVAIKAKGEKPSFSSPLPPAQKKGLPRVLVLGTGGTIASRIDYRTGAVRPAVSASELYALIPELSEVSRVEPEILFSILSENIEPSHWSRLATRIGGAVREGYRGVVVMHGTDTLGYTAAALSFALQGVPIPVLLVGAQRSSDRPSSDAALNLIGAVAVAAGAEFSGVYVAMHLDGSDDRIAIHRGTRVRKNHTSARDAFKSVGVPLAAVWSRQGLSEEQEGLPRRTSSSAFKPRARFDRRAMLLKFYPSMPVDLLRAARRTGMRCIVLEGTGMGHISSACVEFLKEYTKGGCAAFMTSQCMNGRVDMNVYETGADLLNAGVVPLSDMLAETALAKAMWALGNCRTVTALKEEMVKDLAGETTQRTTSG